MPAFFLRYHQQESCKTAQDEACHDGLQQLLLSEPESKDSDELDVAAANGPTQQYGQQQENQAASQCGFDMRQDGRWISEQKRKGEQSKGQQHAVKNDILLKICAGHEQ